MTATSTNKRPERREPQYVYAERPRCPSCGDAEHETNRSVDQGDGTRLQHCRCRLCGCRFRIVWE